MKYNPDQRAAGSRAIEGLVKRFLRSKLPVTPARLRALSAAALYLAESDRYWKDLAPYFAYRTGPQLRAFVVAALTPHRYS